MKIRFLGTNGWYPTPTGDTPCILIDSKDAYVVLDAGNGIYKLDKYITEEKPILLFISHFHIDHVSGVHIFNKFNFKQGLDVYVGEGRSKDFETIVNPPFTIGYKKSERNITNNNFDLRLHELSENGENIPFPAKAIKLFHAYEDHGYRFEIDGKIIAYTGDTGVTERLNTLAKDADLLISECSNKKTEEGDKWGHLDPYQAAEIAKNSNVKKLILTHFGTKFYNNFQDREWAEQEAKKIFSNTASARDDLEIEI